MRYEAVQDRDHDSEENWDVVDHQEQETITGHREMMTACLIATAMNEADERARSGAEELREALEMLFKFFDCSGEAINSRWDKVPPEDRVAIVKAARQALKGGKSDG